MKKKKIKQVICRMNDEMDDLEERIQNLEKQPRPSTSKAHENRHANNQSVEELENQVKDLVGRLKRLESIIEGREHNEKVEYDHIVEDNKKVAVYAPEAWMKEKVAKVWGIKDDFIYHKQCAPIIHKENSVNHRIVACQTKEYAEETGYTVIDFQDFCNKHSISDKPDIIEDENGIIWKVEKWIRDPNYNTYLPLVTNDKYISVYKPQTNKRLDDEINKNE